jgi:trans-aconitate methyltransferase
MSLKKITEHYRCRVDTKRESHDILDWASREEQHIRFQILFEAIQTILPSKDLGKEPLRLLDVGCGLGNLRPFLLERLPRLEYVGVDITEEILHEGHRRQADCPLVLGDVFTQAPFRGQAFDVVFCSGVFNLQLGNNDAFIQRALPALFQLSRRLTVANFLHERNPQQYEHCHYTNPDKVLAAVPADASLATIRDDYLDKDFTLCVKR